MNVVFMGGNELGAITLEHLIKNSIDIVGVIVTKTNDPWYSGVDKIANKYGISLFEEININNSECINNIRKLQPDLIVSVNFAQILKKEMINIPTKGCINTHASLLPMYKGRAPLNWAMINGEKEVGVTVHYIEEGIDTGDIIIQEKIIVDEKDYINDILKKVKKIYPNIVLKAIKLIENDDVKLIHQANEGSYFGKRTIEDGEINVEDHPTNIMNLIRAVSRPYPGAYINNDYYRIIIWKAKLSYEDSYNYELKFNGDFVKEDDNIIIKLKDCLLISNDYDLFKKA